MTDNPFDFSDRTVVVFGGTSGINLGIANAFATRGAKVAVASRDQGKVDAAVAQLTAHGGPAIGFSADVREPEAVDKVMAGINEAFGEFDVLVSGAAGNFPAPAMGISPNGFKAVVEIDLLGTFHVMRAAYPYLRKPGASIVNISAPQAYVPMPYQVHVCAAKAGVDMVTRVLALEWGPEGIRVNSVVPGPIAGTEGMKRLAPTPEIMAAVSQSVPLGRCGNLEDTANAVMFLASPVGGFVNGAVLPADGGWSLGGVSVAAHAMANAAKGAARAK